MEPQSPNAGAQSTTPGRFLASRTTSHWRRQTNAAGTIAGGVCSLSFFAATCLLLWLIVTQHENRVRAGNTGNTSFCCPEEAAQLHAVISRTVSPCSDFFAYVCENAIKSGFIQEGVSQDILLKIKGNIIRGTQNMESRTARALHWLYSSCMSEIWQQDRRQSEIASFVLDEVNATSSMGQSELLRFALTIQARYKLRFFFTIASSETITLFHRKYIRSSFYELFCSNSCFSNALPVVNARLHTNYTLQDFVHFERLLPDDNEERDIEVLDIRELLDALGKTNKSMFGAYLTEFFPRFNISTPTYAISKDSMLDEISVLWNVSNQPLTLFYMLTIVVLDAMIQVQNTRVLDAPTRYTWHICDAHSNKYDELWRATYVAALTSPTKNRRMRVIFEATRAAMLNYAPLRTMVAAGKQAGHLDALLGSMTVILPGDLVLSDLGVPEVSPHGFVRNYFRALSFEFDVWREKVRRGAVTTLNEDVVQGRIERINDTHFYVPATAYSTLSASKSDSLLADAPVIAIDMAAQIWSGVEKYKQWNSRTAAAIHSHRKCMLKSLKALKYKAPFAMTATVAVQIAAKVATSEGVVTRSNSATATDWWDVKRIWSLFRMSKAQFFYARYAYFRCSATESSRLLVNEPLRRIEDFGVAFQCTSQDLVNVSACMDVNV